MLSRMKCWSSPITTTLESRVNMMTGIGIGGMNSDKSEVPLVRDDKDDAGTTKF